MKRLKLILTLVLITGSAYLSAQQITMPADISLAFKAGNVDKLSEYLNSTVELVILGKEDFYKKSVAEGIIRDFFKEYPATEFVIKHQGGPNDAYYAIGDLTTKKGSFRVYFLIKRVNSKPLIHQLRIEVNEK